MANNLLELSLNLPFVDEQWQRFRADPQSVDPTWRALFTDGGGGLAPSNGTGAANGGVLRTDIGAALAEAAAARMQPIEVPITPAGPIDDRGARIFAMVNYYRARGHLEAELDPLDHLPRVHHSDLDPATWGFGPAELAQDVPSGGFFGAERLPLGELIRRLRATYCGHLAVEMMHITETERRAWLQQRMEPTLNQATLDRDTQLYILDRLAAAESLERFIHTKYVGTKRFSLEGSETLIPLLDLVLERAGIHGVEEVVIGMAHRGRLNVLVNLMGKRAADVFAEFEDVDPEKMFGGGDVKYHLGFSSDRETRAGHKQHLTLAFNPSHLEAVDPVAVGRVRAKQRRRRDFKRERVLGILVHGDAAFAGQGLVSETLNLSQLRGYRTGGTVHVIVNNQIGFTTAPTSSRSTTYCSDVAKAVQVPIFHVNGDDPEAVAQAVRLAMDYRREFHTDVVIDMFCFRKYGHNEGDEPAFTQPLLYQKIEAHPTVREIYARSLEQRGVINRDDAAWIVKRREQHLDSEFARERAARPAITTGGGVWRGYAGGPDRAAPDVETGVGREALTRITERLTTLPDGFRAHPKIARVLQQRARMGRGEEPLDWGMAEALAFGSIVDEGALVRLTGQDSRRGTFSHRHAVVVDQRTEQEYLPLEHIRDGQGWFRIYDSPLSEAAVLGFELGYSLDYPDGLVIWEAQFGDFVNGAQVIIDQFITSSEDKWKRLSGLTLLLPHGFEGQGPEHSSARFERFLEACAEDNIQVCYPSTPGQYFHMLRRQVVRKWRKPLVCLTPKSLLRLPAAKSPVEELARGEFHRILDDPSPPDRERVRRVLLCTGKIYYELAEERQKRRDEATAIVRLEQLYPLRSAELASLLDAYDQAEEVVWVQEEPANMGARNFVMPRLFELAAHRQVAAVTREESASPATGSYKAHALEQAAIIDRAFGPIDQLE
jgi:2-oxoglutarate dehydrogenase E1 component